VRFRSCFFLRIIFLFLSILPESLLFAGVKGYGGSFADLKNKVSDYKNVSFRLNKLTFYADVPFSEQEFLYLTGFRLGQFITVKDVDHAYKQLIYKKRFKNIDIDLNEQEGGKHLHFRLTANWLFKKLILRGIWFDQYQYAELYLQQPGDVFDLALHEESIRAIKKLLCDRGYFNGDVEDELIYEKSSKTIIAKINIKRGCCFRINEVSFKLKSMEKQGDEVKNALENINLKLGRKFKNDLIKAYYSRNLIEKQVKKIKYFLRQKGYLNYCVAVKRLIDKKSLKINIVFDISLGKKWKVKFRGNSFFSNEFIKENILSIDKPSWLFSPQIIAQQLLQEYWKKGYWKVEINYKVQPNGVVMFNIKEGAATLIDGVQIKDSRTGIIEDPQVFFSELLKDKIYDEDLLSFGLENLKKFYKANGFWNFKILEKKVAKNGEDKRYTIMVHVDKGKQYFYGDATVEQFEQLNKSNFFKKYEGQKSNLLVPFDVSWLSEQRFFLINYFQKQGYWYVDAYPELQFEQLPEDKIIRAEGVKVFVVWKVDLGKKVKFGKLLLRGNTRLPFDRVIKELRFKEGELWDKKKLDFTAQKFKKLDIFKTIQFEPYKVSKVSDVKPIILTLVDDDPFEVRLRTGYFLTSKNFLFKRQSTYKLGSSLIMKNPTNSADKLLFNADVTRFERKLDVDYQFPSPLGLSLMSKFKMYANKYIHPVQIGQSGSAYEAIQNGFLLGLSDEYKRHYYWGVNIGNEWMETSRVRGNLKFSEKLIDKTVPFFFIEPSLVVDRLDDRINVSRGSLSFFSLKMMVPSKISQPICKFMFEQSFFKPVHNEVIGAIRFRWGHIFKDDFEYIMPIERFYLGGPYSVRGYEKDAVPPLGLTKTTKDDGTVIKEYTIQGGSSMINGNLEVRFSIYKSFKGVVFQDIGVLSQSGFSGFKGKWYPSSGFGFRYKTPIGSLRFDIGWKWKKRLKGDTPYAWYLTLGEAF